MKTTIKLAVIVLIGLSLNAHAQWNNAGDNTTTGNLTVGGSINATGLNKRLFLGGSGGSTFGLAYSGSYPNYGIFYTEGSPDFVSISPNGNATNGIMNVFGDGNVGIGTAAPSGSISSNQTGLHIANNNVSYLSLESTSGSGKKYTMYTSPTGNLVFWDATSATLRGTIDTNGRWGIGTASPSEELEIKATSPSLLLSTLDPNNNYQLGITANHNYGNKFTFTYGNATFLQEKNIDNVGETPNSKLFMSNYYGLGFSTNTLNPTSNDQIDFYISGNGSPNGSGNIGIGTTNPSHKLSVTSSANSLMELSSSTTGTWMDFENTGAAEGARVWTIGHAGSSGNFGIAQRDGIDEYRLVVDNDGNVGIGKTDPSSKLEVYNSSVEETFKLTTGTDGRILTLRGETINFKRAGANYIAASNASGTLNFSTGGSDIYNSQIRMRITSSGDVGIGTNDPKSKLAVNGDIRATEVTVLADVTVPDYVFEPDYELRTLKETKKYIEENRHLPEIPSASEIGENGIDLGEMNMKLLKKIEELTLYQIELLEKLEAQSERLQQVENELNTLKK